MNHRQGQFSFPFFCQCYATSTAKLAHPATANANGLLIPFALLTFILCESDSLLYRGGNAEEEVIPKLDFLRILFSARIPAADFHTALYPSWTTR